MEKIYPLLSRLQELSEKLVLTLNEPTCEKEVLLLFAITKSNKTLNAVMLLCRNGFGEDAAILSRSLFELTLNIEYIFSQEDDYLAKRFFAYDWIERKEMHDYLKTTPSFDPSKEKLNLIDNIEEEAKKAQEIYKFKKYGGWSDKTTREMAIFCNCLNIYSTAYRLQCSLSHPNPRSSNHFFKETKDGLTLDAGPSNNFIKESLVSTFTAFFEIVNRVNIYFEKEFEKDIHEIGDEFKKII